ncbi:MAG: division/cell wall cluster transcriptional repressor MraZ [Candidatus Pacebacteria bacterium CG1_02_43_31]|nr:division/cell wall cluster transcriptional repressor MraZ [Candidatus Pacearchaeota archaeon]NCQ65470.1 division/cell wall cluster transcriptional repressor MraZ [Candidatus Paceibacterota bacterium]NCS86724.1 division/cell wall cluster transcriptional repressor MraZ [Candidatus Paceibacterota bacterium]OIO45129.1 MAG: division/cell wall cluster transcriptional repressor MraZ [Candidatus Pacebacteria bacterium CG1_02_43_31]
MFIGKFYHSLEEKGRISLPKKFRRESDSWIVTRGLDGGLFIFKEEDFEKEIAKFESRTFTKKNNRDFIRLMTNEAQEIQPDKTGRVQLPEYLIEFAKLKKSIVIVGSLSRLEVWDRDLYHDYIDGIEDKTEEIAESLEEGITEN